MIFQEPGRTPYDWQFSLFGIPIRVHPLFWLVALLLANSNQGTQITAWVASMFVSILIHEMGHAVAFRYFGTEPHIVLYSFGGLAIPNGRLTSVKRGQEGFAQILISLAGPVAGFLLAGLIVLGLYAANQKTDVFLFDRPQSIGRGNVIGNENVRMVIRMLIYINVYWGLINLLPVYPLDGGRVSREIFLANSQDGVRQSLMLSMIAASGIAFMAIAFWELTYLGLLFGYMAFQNYQMISGPYGGGYDRW